MAHRAQWPELLSERRLKQAHNFVLDGPRPCRLRQIPTDEHANQQSNQCRHDEIFLQETGSQQQLGKLHPKPSVVKKDYLSNQAAKSCSRIGCRLAPQSPGLASNTPAQGVPQDEHLPSAVKFHSVNSYQSRPINAVPHWWQ
jgi:hypothetical protein